MKAAATLEMIKRRFAGSEQDVERVFAASDSFQGLCRDYLACAAALARWRESPAAEASLRVREYSEILTELTKEILDRLAPSPGAGHGAGSRTSNPQQQG